MTFSERKASFKKFLVLVDINKTRNSSVFKTRNIKTVHYGLKTTVYVDWKIWELVSQKMEDSENINIFKSDIELEKKKIILHVIYLNRTYHESDFFETPFVYCFLIALIDFYSIYAFAFLISKIYFNVDIYSSSSCHCCYCYLKL